MCRQSLDQALARLAVLDTVNPVHELSLVESFVSQSVIRKRQALRKVDGPVGRSAGRDQGFALIFPLQVVKSLVRVV